MAKQYLDLAGVERFLSKIKTWATGVFASKTDIESMNKEAYLTWGGRSVSGDVTPLDAAVSELHSANRIAFANADGITIEYSADGINYADYGATDAQKVGLVSGIEQQIKVGNGNPSTSSTLRITLNATGCGVYTRMQKLLLYITTQGTTGNTVKIETSTIGNPSQFTELGVYGISGWSGWNSIPAPITFGGGDTQTTHIGVIRLTFGWTGFHSGYTENAFQVKNISIIGPTAWRHPSAMSRNGHLYSYDTDGNASFPALVKQGSKDIGGSTRPVYISGGVTTACAHTLGTSVPSNAKFTDTTYSGMSADEASSGSSATNRLISPKVLHNKIAKEIEAIPVMTGATATSTGKTGLVPAPSSGSQTKYLRGDGTWSNIEASVPGGTMIWGGFLSTAAYATDYAVGTVLKVNTSESLYILKGGSLVSTSVSLGTNLIVSNETYMSGTSNTSGKVFLEF